MSQDDIDNGRLICLIGIAPVRPAEFVIFRIQQKTRELVPLSAQERARWVNAFKPMIQKQVADGEKAGLPARGLVSAYGLLS